MITTVLSNRPGGSASRLARALGVGRASPADVRNAPRSDRYVINWGTTQTPANFRQRRLTYSNGPIAVSVCSDKRETFLALKNAGVSAVASADRHDAGWDVAVAQWLERDGKIVVRNVVNGHSGAGIQIIRRGQEIPNAPLYTRYFKKDAEYRVHVFYGRVILIQQKRRENGREQTEIEKLVRTHAHGWVFTTQNLDCDRLAYRGGLSDLAIAACTAVGCNHAAVDILTKHHAFDDGRDPTSVVVEVNSAPALRADSTLNAYRDAFAAKIRELGE